MDNIFSGGRFPSSGGFGGRLPSGSYIGADYRELARGILDSARNYAEGIEKASRARPLPIHWDTAVLTFAESHAGQEYDPEILQVHLNRLAAEDFWENVADIRNKLEARKEKFGF